MKTERLRDRFMPWAGLALGTVGFFLAQQIGSDATFDAFFRRGGRGATTSTTQATTSTTQEAQAGIGPRSRPGTLSRLAIAGAGFRHG